MSNTNDLFTGEHVLSAMKSMSVDDLAKYKEIGQHMYGSVNFTDSEIIKTLPAPMYEAVAFIEDQIRSGMHISMLEDNEKAVMQDAYSSNWYERYGYVEDDLNDIITLTPVPNTEWKPVTTKSKPDVKKDVKKDIKKDVKMKPARKVGGVRR